MKKATAPKNCFIIMPVTTPKESIQTYKGDKDHFDHVLNHLFIPALKEAGFNAIPPKSTGSDIIQAEIIKRLSEADLVLCDISILNPNVFFEFGIRTALDKPIALVVDDKVDDLPFDTAIINFHRYSSSLALWDIQAQVRAMKDHIVTAYEQSDGRSALWKYFGVAQKGTFKPGESDLGDKIELLTKEITAYRADLHKQKLLDRVNKIMGKKSLLAEALRTPPLGPIVGKEFSSEWAIPPPAPDEL